MAFVKYMLQKEIGVRGQDTPDVQQHMAVIARQHLILYGAGHYVAWGQVKATVIVLHEPVGLIAQRSEAAQ